MPTCPAGHESTATDYCDTCGAPIGGNPSTASSTSAAPAPAAVPCPACNEPVVGRFCESCGFDIEAGTAVAPSLRLTLSADRSHWKRMVGSGEPAFPSVSPTLELEVSGDQAVLGRARSGDDPPIELALTGSAADAAVSHRQLQLRRDGQTWLVQDLGSANGTWLNDADAPLPANEEHPLHDGDRLLIGAWTCLTVHLSTT